MTYPHPPFPGVGLGVSSKNAGPTNTVFDPLHALFGKSEFTPPSGMGYRRENLDWQDAFSENGQMARDLVIHQFSTAEQVYNLALLPWKESANVGSIRLGEIRFDSAIMNPRPEESISRLTTSTRSVRELAFDVHGIALRLEHGFWNTAEGMEYFAFSLQQLANAMLATVGLGAARALMYAPEYKDPAQGVGQSYGLREFKKQLREEIDTFGIFQKHVRGVQMAVGRCKERLSSRGVTPNAVVIPAGTRAYMNDLGLMLDDNPLVTPKNHPNLKNLGGVYESVAFPTGGEHGRQDPLIEKNVEIGQYYTMFYEHLSAAAAASRTAARSIAPWSEDDLNYRPIHLKQALDACGLFTGPDHALTHEGERFFAGFDTWGQYLRAQGMYDEVEPLVRGKRIDYGAAGGGAFVAPAGAGAGAGAGAMQALTTALYGIQATGPGGVPIGAVRRFLRIGQSSWGAATAALAGKLNDTKAPGDWHYDADMHLVEQKGVAPSTTFFPGGVHTPQVVGEFNALVDAARAEHAANGGTAGRAVVEEDVDTSAELKIGTGPVGGPFKISQLTRAKMVETKIENKTLQKFVRNVQGDMLSSPIFWDEFQGRIVQTLINRVLHKDPTDAEDNAISLGVAKYAFRVWLLFAANTYNTLHRLAFNRKVRQGTVAPDRKTLTHEEMARFFDSEDMVGTVHSREWELFISFMRESSRTIAGSELRQRAAAGSVADLNNAGAGAGVPDTAFYSPLKQTLENGPALDPSTDKVNGPSNRIMTRIREANVRIDATTMFPVVQAAIAQAAPVAQTAPLDRADINSGAFLYWCADNNYPVALNFLVFKPHMRYQCGTAVVCKGGSDLGHTYYANIDFQLGRKVNTKMISAHLTGRMSAHVKSEKYLTHARRCYVKAYERGGGTKIWYPSTENIERYAQGNMGNRSIFIVPSYPAERTRLDENGGFLDITGNLDPAFGLNEADEDDEGHGLHYQAAPIMQGLWGWVHTPSESVEDETQRYNTVCCLGNQLNAKVEDGQVVSWSTPTHNTGHLGNSLRPGSSLWSLGHIPGSADPSVSNQLSMRM